jgi:hypothetical protein
MFIQDTTTNDSTQITAREQIYPRQYSRMNSVNFKIECLRSWSKLLYDCIVGVRSLVLRVCPIQSLIGIWHR